LFRSTRARMVSELATLQAWRDILFFRRAARRDRRHGHKLGE
jgi:hypothetical protein